MRVLQVLEATLGGTRRYLEDISEALGDGHDNGLVYSLHRADGGFIALLDVLRRRGWQVFELDMVREIDPVRDVRCVRALRRVYRTFQPDVVNAHSSKAGALARIAAVGAPRPPSVAYAPHSIATRLSWAYLAIEKLLAPRSDVMIAVTESERDELRRLGLVPLERIMVAVPTVRCDEFAPLDRTVARARLGLDAGPIVVGVGRLTPQKDPLTFVEIAAALRERVPDARAIWVGDGAMRAAVEARAHALGMGDALTITGWLDDVRPYLAAADVYLAPSRYESFGYATAEALAMERPVVASRITGTVDVVREDAGAQLFALGDVAGAVARIVYFLENPLVAAGVAQHGRAFVAKAFSAAETRRGLLAAYRAALGRSAP